VSNIQVLWAVEPRLHSDVWKQLIQGEPDIQIVGETYDPVDMLVAVGQTHANVLVHSWPDSPRMPEICSFLLQEYPELLVIGISPKADVYAYACQQTITTRRLASPRQVIASIRQQE